MKKIAAAIVSLVMCLSLTVCAYADFQPVDQIDEAPGAVTRAEEFTWVYRKNPDTGAYEKRCWSNTYGRWVTDWIPV